MSLNHDDRPGRSVGLDHPQETTIAAIEADRSRGSPLAKACRRAEISVATYYRHRPPAAPPCPPTDFIWQHRGTVAYGPRPGHPKPAYNRDDCRLWLRRLGDEGIRTVVDLLDPDEHDAYGRQVAPSLGELCERAGLCYVALGLAADEGAWSFPAQLAWLRRLRRSLVRPVFVCCNSGLERSKHAAHTLARPAGAPAGPRRPAAR